MVKIAIAGGSGSVAGEIIDGLLERKKHEIIILSRKEAPEEEDRPGVTWAKVDYANKESLIPVLKGVHTVLSFVVAHQDPGNVSQKGLIHASIDAGVKRFAPSEWASAGTRGLDWYAGKAELREYLAALNEKEKVLEYTLFQPGFFLDYLATPYQTAKNLTPVNLNYDLQSRRAILLAPSAEPRADILTLTAAKDVVAVVVRAIEDEREWPVDGGIRGNAFSLNGILEAVEKVRGPFTVERLNLSDLEAGNVKSSWLPRVDHPSLAVASEEERHALSRMMLSGILVAVAHGSWDVSDSWNKRFPDLEFTKIEDFVRQVWDGKP